MPKTEWQTAENIRRLNHQEGLSCGEIAKKYGVSRQRVHQVAQGLGVKIRTHARHAFYEEWENLKRVSDGEIESGWLVEALDEEQLADRWGTTSRAVRERTRSLGLRTLQNHQRRRLKRAGADARRFFSRDWLAEQYESHSLAEIADVVGVPTMTLYHQMKRLGIQTRSRGERIPENTHND